MNNGNDDRCPICKRKLAYITRRKGEKVCILHGVVGLVEKKDEKKK